MTARTYDLIAAVALATAVVVIVVIPVLLDDPNVLSTPAAVVVAIGSGGALLGGRGGRAISWVVSITGLVLSLLWLWLASDGFGQGTPWVDDMIEAGLLAGAFLASAIVLLLGRRRSTVT